MIKLFKVENFGYGVGILVFHDDALCIKFQFLHSGFDRHVFEKFVM